MFALEPGAAAPDLELRDHHGQRRVLSAVRGRPVALVFFPAAFSSVCGSELAALRDWWADPAGRPESAELWAISCDLMFSLRGYADAEGIDFPLLSDFWPHGAVAQAYGVFDETSGTPRRSSYVVDAEGRIAWAVHNAPRDPRPVAHLRAALEALGR